MALARKVLAGFAWLYVLAVAAQFFVAGLALLGGEGQDAWDIHEAFGYSALHLTPVLMLVLAFVAKASRTLLVLTFVFAVVSFLQPLWVAEFRGEFLGSFHILGALVVLALAHAVAERSTALAREPV